MKLHATPSNYAEWGAEAGIAMAKVALTHPFAPLATNKERREAIGAGFNKINRIARELRKLGASADEAQLYLGTARKAFDAQMAHPDAKIELVVTGAVK